MVNEVPEEERFWTVVEGVPPQKFLTKADADAYAALQATTKPAQPYYVQDSVSKLLVPLTPDQRPIVIVAMGQSNVSNAALYDWNPPANVQVWSQVPGTVSAFGFVPVNKAVVSMPLAYAARVAQANPTRPVRLYVLASPGRSLYHWNNGVPYAYWAPVRTAPVIGAVAYNHSVPHKATRLFVSRTTIESLDAWGPLYILRFERTLRITSADNANLWIDFQVSGIPVESSLGWTIPVTYAGGWPNAMQHQSKVFFQLEPRLPLVAAEQWPRVLEAMPHYDGTHHFVWWQGESDSRDPRGYQVQWNEQMARWTALNMIQADTKIVIFQPGPQTDNLALVEQLRNLVQADNVNRMFFETSRETPAGSFLPMPDPHMTPAGYWAAGTRAAERAIIKWDNPS